MSAVDLNGVQMRRLQDAYGFFDKKGEGIGAPLVKNVMLLLGRKLGDAEIAQAIAQVDTKKQGKVGFEDFLNCVASREVKEGAEGGIPVEKDKDLKDVFDAFDKAGGGRIGANQIRNCLADLGENTSDEEMRELMKILGGRPVDFEGFVRLYQAA